MSLRGDLYNPIAGDNPCGQDLRYSAVYGQVKEARRQEEDLDQGAWKRERKVADFALVIKLAQEAIATESKDLQLAAWLTEALLHKEGFPGLERGLVCCRELILRFGIKLYPASDDADLEPLAAPLDWLGSCFEIPVKMAALNSAGHNWFQFKESRLVGYEDQAKDASQKKAREKAIKDGKLSPEDFDKAFESTPKLFYSSNEKSLDGALVEIKQLNELCQKTFGDQAPGFGKLSSAIEEVRHAIHQLLEKKRQVDPDPISTPIQTSESPTQGSQQSRQSTKIDEPPPIIKPAADQNGNDSSGHTAADAFVAATAAMGAGEHQKAFEIMREEIARQRSGRGRFFRSLQLVQLCVAAKKEAVAQPILEDLAAAVEAHKIEEWEEREAVAGALATIMAASKRIQGDAKEKQKYFERICRLDPVKALSVGM
jgi:type VI secretion system ImpA family protein